MVRFIRRGAVGGGLLMTAAGSAVAFEDAPPARTTGGYGEDSCHACHFGSDENDAAGALTLRGLPERFAPGERYTLMLGLTRNAMASAGFQLAIRRAGDGTQAGALDVPEEERTRLALTSARDVEYAHHVIGGTGVVEKGASHWTIHWRAPDGGGPVVVHAAAVAGDGDASQIGDHVYTLERIVDPLLAEHVDGRR